MLRSCGAMFLGITQISISTNNVLVPTRNAHCSHSAFVDQNHELRSTATDVDHELTRASDLTLSTAIHTCLLLVSTKRAQRVPACNSGNRSSAIFLVLFTCTIWKHRNYNLEVRVQSYVQRGNSANNLHTTSEWLGLSYMLTKHNLLWLEQPPPLDIGCALHATRNSFTTDHMRSFAGIICSWRRNTRFKYVVMNKLVPHLDIVLLVAFSC